VLKRRRFTTTKPSKTASLLEQVWNSSTEKQEQGRNPLLDNRYVMTLAPLERYCESWEALQSTIEELAGATPYRWLFRGHRKASWRLEPSLERCEPNKLLSTELRFYEEFRSKAHLYTDTTPPLDDDVGWLSAMQHHGVPTRLLDWSYSAFVALFFAVEHSGTEPNAALWGINMELLERRYKAFIVGEFGLPPEAKLEARENFRTIAFPYAFTDTTKGLIVPILPQFHVSRLSSQQGCFLLNCNYLTTFEDSLAQMMAGETAIWLYKITLPHTLRKECLRRLMHFNIHPASLYPDLDGLAKFLTLKNELFPIQ
jgi:hypothetical protein